MSLLFVLTCDIQVIKDFYHRTPSIWVGVFRAKCHCWEHNIFDWNNHGFWLYWIRIPCYKERKHNFIGLSQVSKLIPLIWSLNLQNTAILSWSDAYIVNVNNTSDQKHRVFNVAFFSTKNPKPWMLVFPAKSFNAWKTPILQDIRLYRQ